MSEVTDQLRLDPETHTYYLGERRIPSYSGIVADMGITKPNPFYTDSGREEGIGLHMWLHFLASGRVPMSEPDPRIAGRVEGIRKFLRDTKPVFVGAEEPQYHPSGYATTPDLWCHIGNWAWIIDAKRGAKLPSHRLQTAAQSLALAHAGFRGQKRGALYLKDGDYRLDEHSDAQDMPRWLCIVAAYHVSQSYK